MKTENQMLWTLEDFKDIRLAVFNISGTLINDGLAVPHALCMAFALHGHFAPLETCKLAIGRPISEGIRLILNAISKNPDAEIIWEVNRSFSRAINDWYLTNSDLRELNGTTELLCYLKQNGVFVALNTGFSRKTVEVLLSRFPWMRDGLVDFYVAGDEIAMGRPHPEMIERCMEASGVRDAELVMKVGHSPLDIEEGHNANCGRVVAMMSGSFEPSVIHPLMPHFAVRSPKELLQVFHGQELRTSA